MTKTIELTPSESPNVFRIGKELFILKEEQRGVDNHIKKLIFEKTNQEEYCRQITGLAKEILKTKDIDRQTILEQALLSLSKDDLNKVKERLAKFDKPKYKKGCLSIDVDGIEVPIFKRASFLD